jgi:hypothetical protein
MAHGDTICRTKAPHVVSWYSPHLRALPGLIERAGANRALSIIDGAALANLLLVDNLIQRGLHESPRSDISRNGLRCDEEALRLECECAEVPAT